MKQEAVIVIALTLASVAMGRESFDVRGIGHIGVQTVGTGQVTVTEFSTESPSAAQALASKRLSDIESFGDFRQESSSRGTVISDEGAGMRLLGVKGTSFYEAWSSSPEADIAAALPSDVEPVTRNAYPKFLDCFDKGGPGVWIGGGGSRYRIPDDFEWIVKNGIDTFTPCRPGRDRLVEPGLVDFSLTDWAATMAEKYDLGYRQLFFPSVNSSSYNRTPLPYVKPMPEFVGLTKFMFPNQQEEGYEWPCDAIDGIQHDLIRRMAERYGGLDGRLLGWHLATEIPGANVIDLAAIAETPKIKELWKSFCRERGVDDGDGRVPVPTDFIGGEKSVSLDIFNGDWEAKPLCAGAADTNSWVRARPNDPMLLMYVKYLGSRVKDFNSLKFRRTFTVPESVLKDSRYLHLATTRYHNHSWNFDPQVLINGVEARQIAKDAYISKCYDVEGLLRAGENHIEIETRGCLIPGYAFFNSVPLKPYPYMSEELNARFYNGCEFAVYLRLKKVEEDLKALRSVDPYRPIKLMSTIEYLDSMMPLCRKYGAYQHDTGGGAAWWCPFSGSRLAKGHGVAASCEQAGPPWDYAWGKPGMGLEFMKKTLTLYLNYPLDCADLVFAAEHYAHSTAKGVTEWFEENVGLFKSIGKLYIPDPKVAVLRSTRLIRLGFFDLGDYDLKKDFDPGRGLLQEFGRQYVYLETSDLNDPAMLDRFPVIIDIGTILMSQSEAEAIRDYVTRGGVFVSQCVTGRHSPVRADAHPLENALGVSFSDADSTEYRIGEGRFIRLGTEKLAHDAAFYNELLTGLGILRDSQSTEPQTLWGSHFVSKNGIYDVYIASRMQTPSDTNKLDSVKFFRENSPTVVRDFGSKGHPKVDVVSTADGFSTPAEKFGEWTTRLYAVPKSDQSRAAVNWLRSLAELWQPVTGAVREKAVEPGPYIVPLVDGWHSDDGRDVKLGLFATMEYPENAVRTFTRSVTIPAAWKNRSVSLVFNAPYWFSGLLPYGEVFVNGRPQRGNPHRPSPSGSFVLDVTEAAKNGVLQLEVRIDGTKDEETWHNWDYKKDVQKTPWGISGIFYLKADERPLGCMALEGPWTAYTDFGQNGRILEKDVPVECRYAETEFVIPAAYRDARIELHNPVGGVPGFILNGHILDLRSSVDRIDVSGFVNRTGVNVLRVVAGELNHVITVERRKLSRPSLELVFH